MKTLLAAIVLGVLVGCGAAPVQTGNQAIVEDKASFQAMDDYMANGPLDPTRAQRLCYVVCKTSNGLVDGMIVCGNRASGCTVYGEIDDVANAILDSF